MHARIRERLRDAGLAGVARTLLARPARARFITVFMYHRVLEEPHPIRIWDLDAETFGWQMTLVRDAFNVLPLTEAVQRLERRGLPPRAACITFDDGYADNESLALPILSRLGLPATFFVASGYLDGRCMWNDRVVESVAATGAAYLDLSYLGLGKLSVKTALERRRAILQILGKLKYLPPEQREAATNRVEETAGKNDCSGLMMSESQVRRMHEAGMEIGAHTVNHPILALLNGTDARWEIEESKAQLEAITGHRVTSFAYPNGKPGKDYGPEHVSMVRAAGFEGAVTTMSGVTRHGTDRLQMPRCSPWGRDPLKFSVQVIRNAYVAAG